MGEEKTTNWIVAKGGEKLNTPLPPTLGGNPVAYLRAERGQLPRAANVKGRINSLEKRRRVCYTFSIYFL